MLSSNQIAAAFLARIEEEALLALRLMQLVPAGAAEWRPTYSATATTPFTSAELCAHLCDALSGVYSVLVKLTAGESPAAEALRARVKGSSSGSIADSRVLLADLLEAIRECFPRIGDSDLARTVPTYFTTGGKPAATMLLTNLAHFTNHKYQLFTYLKMLDVPVSTEDLYRFDT